MTNTIFRYDIKDYEILEIIGGSGKKWEYKNLNRVFNNPINNKTKRVEKKVNRNLNFLVNPQNLNADDTYYTDGNLTFKSCFVKVLIKKKK